MNILCFLLILYQVSAALSFSNLSSLKDLLIKDDRLGYVKINPMGALSQYYTYLLHQSGCMHNKRFFSPEINIFYSLKGVKPCIGNIKHLYKRNYLDDKAHLPDANNEIECYLEDYHNTLIKMFPSTLHKLSINSPYSKGFTIFLLNIQDKKVVYHLLASLLLISEGVDIPLEFQSCSNYSELILYRSNRDKASAHFIIKMYPIVERSFSSTTYGKKTFRKSHAETIIRFFIKNRNNPLLHDKGPFSYPKTWEAFKTGMFMNSPKFLIQTYIYEFIKTPPEMAFLIKSVHTLLHEQMVYEEKQEADEIKRIITCKPKSHASFLKKPFSILFKTIKKTVHKTEPESKIDSENRTDLKPPIIMPLAHIVFKSLFVLYNSQFSLDKSISQVLSIIENIKRSSKTKFISFKIFENNPPILYPSTTYGNWDLEHIIMEGIKRPHQKPTSITMNTAILYLFECFMYHPEDSEYVLTHLPRSASNALKKFFTNYPTPHATIKGKVLYEWNGVVSNLLEGMVEYTDENRTNLKPGLLNMFTAICVLSGMYPLVKHDLMRLREMAREKKNLKSIYSKVSRQMEDLFIKISGYGKNGSRSSEIYSESTPTVRPNLDIKVNFVGMDELIVQTDQTELFGDLTLSYIQDGLEESLELNIREDTMYVFYPNSKRNRMSSFTYELFTYIAKNLSSRRNMAELALANYIQYQLRVFNCEDDMLIKTLSHEARQITKGTHHGLERFFMIGPIYQYDYKKNIAICALMNDLKNTLFNNTPSIRMVSNIIGSIIPHTEALQKELLSILFYAANYENLYPNICISSQISKHYKLDEYTVIKLLDYLAYLESVEGILKCLSIYLNIGEYPIIHCLFHLLELAPLHVKQRMLACLTIGGKTIKYLNDLENIAKDARAKSRAKAGVKCIPGEDVQNANLFWLIWMSIACHEAPVYAIVIKGCYDSVVFQNNKIDTGVDHYLQYSANSLYTLTHMKRHLCIQFIRKSNDKFLAIRKIFEDRIEKEKHLLEIRKKLLL
ncbi:hypothetical protein NEAUS04_0136 [Nematocida ausubeli]|nr:hypothetical protein NEAUS04_0136 [Nematocida ausubeli]